ncbi:MAG: Uma2 family endonuclease [Candidatus Tectomicrobia bacterium]|nr:Uma2 family endonuclease [Candidatus Tectomicrobia bacterium]
MMTTQLMTAEDLLRMPDDGFRYELVSGELRRMPPAGHTHGRIAATVTGSLVQHVATNKLGTVYAAETGFKLAANPGHVRAPDVAFIRRERVIEVGEIEGYWPGAPDLVVEVVSPSDSYSEVEEKVFDWLEAGTRMVIVINSRRRAVTVYHSLTDIIVLKENDTLDGGKVVPGWTMPVRDLFT